VRRGEIWLYEPPDSKRRPVLILTRNEAISHLHDVIAVPTTRTARGLETEVEIGPDDGMRVESVLALDSTLSAEKAHLKHRVTALGPDKLNAACRALAASTGCD
jgi:mRNA interferase MazF